VQLVTQSVEVPDHAFELCGQVAVLPLEFLVLLGVMLMSVTEGFKL
jgi:hypothetical protein